MAVAAMLKSASNGVFNGNGVAGIRKRKLKHIEEAG